jgi:ATP-dependent DNA helicase RecG
MSPLEQQLRKGESSEMELLASPEPRDKVLASVVAFLNSGGGTIVVGADASGRPVGIEGAAEEANELALHLRKVISPRPLLSVTVEPAFDGEVIVIEVPGGRDTPFLAEGQVFLRRGSRNVLANASDLQRMFQERSPETIRWERRGSPAIDLGELVREEILKTAQVASTEERYRFDDPQTPEAILKDLGMINGGVLTNAADVCFGRKPASRNPQVRLRAFAFQSDKQGDEYLDQADLNGPLANVLSQAIAFIQRNSSNAAQFLSDSAERQRVEAYPTFAVREGLVNALAHRDYASFSSGATALVFPDRVEIWNSGSLPEGWTANKLRNNHPSIPHNPDLANFLFIRNLMERIGRGTQRIIFACRDAGLPSPSWKVDDDGITLTLYSTASKGAPVTQLNERQEGLLESLQTGAQINLRDYIDRFASKVSDRQARRDLKQLIEADLLRIEGKGRAAVYRRTQRTWNR